MVLPVSRAHPAIPQPVTFRANAALPAAGAYDATPLELAVAGYRTLMLFLTYERGADPGAFEFKMEVSPYSANQGSSRDWFQQALYSPGTVVAYNDVISLIQRESISYGATSGAAELFVYGPVDLGINVERLRIFGKETGTVGTPGDLEIIGTLGMEA